MQRWSGTFHLEPGRALYLGPAFDTGAHAHHAFQICVGLDGPIEIRRGGAPESVLVAVVRPDEKHALHAGGRRVALLYLEPESLAGERLAVAPGLSPARAAGLRRALARQSPAAAMASVLGAFSAVPEKRSALDARIARALRLLGAADEALPSSELARRVGLSAGRFRHLFRQQIGLSYRSHRLWRRLSAAIAELRRGVTLTTAAHAAGFADSAHLTRTFRRMFGVTPSSMAPALGGRARATAARTATDSPAAAPRRDRRR